MPQKLCPRFGAAAYNISMALGILATSSLALPLAAGPVPPPGLILAALAGGLLWVAGNYLLIFAVQRAGMARPFCIINLTSVLSFIGGGAALGELGELPPQRLGAMVAAVAAVVAGSVLVGLTSGGSGPGGPTRREVAVGILAAFVAPFFFASFNVIIAYIINTAGVPLGPAFVSFSPGILMGALALALLPEPRSPDTGQAAPSSRSASPEVAPSPPTTSAAGASTPGASSPGEPVARTDGRPAPRASPAVSPEASPALTGWLRAPSRWHALALSQGVIWGVAMYCVMTGWLGTGIALGVPIGQGVITLVSALWGLLVFREFERLENRLRAFSLFLAGAVLTVAGIAAMVAA